MILVTGLNNWEMLSKDINGDEEHQERRTRELGEELSPAVIILKPIVTSRRCMQ